MATMCRLRPVRSAPTCSAICGRRNGAISTRSSRPKGSGDVGYDLTDLLIEAEGRRKSTWSETGEGFFFSLGFEPLPETFYERSQFVKPADREVVCHASAWDVDNVDDIRIKMCIKRQCRRLRHDPPRARPQLLPARLQRAAVSSTTARMTVSTRRSAT